MAKPSKLPNAKKWRVAIDSTVLIAGFGWPRWSHEVLLHALKQDYRLILSDNVIEHAERWFEKNLPAASVLFRDFLNAVGYELAPTPSEDEVAEQITLIRHANDVPVALAYIKAKVDYFVTDDKDFTDEDATTAEVRKHLKIMRPVIFLREVMGWSKEDLEKVRFRNWPLEEGT